MGGESKEGPSARRTALIVAGMHRSGTSALARLLMLLGADGPRNLMPPRKGNEAGHWESEPIVELHDEILATASMSWDDVGPFPVAWLAGPSGEGFRRRAIELVESEYGDSTLFMVKDPRICRLIPFWRSILEELGVEAAFVLPQRNPLEAAASLKARDGIPTPHGLLLWLWHALDAEAATRDLRRAFVSYEQLLRDWESVSRAISGRLGIDFPGLSHPAKLEFEQFISAVGRHHEFTPEELDARPEIVDWVKRAHSVLAAAADANDDPDPEALDEVRSLLRDADLAYGPVLAETNQESKSLAEERDGLAEERDGLAEERDGLAGELRARDETLARRALELEQLAVEVGRRQAELEEAKGQLSHRDAELERMAAALSAAQDEREQVTAGIAEQVQRLRAELAEVTAAVGQVGEAVEQQSQGALRRLARRIGDTRRSASQFSSWILVRPSRERRGYVSTYLALRRSGEFDAGYYRSRYPDVRRARLNPLMHYVESGAAEGRDPNPGFSTKGYLAANPEARRSGVNPFLHWLRAGRRRLPSTRPLMPEPETQAEQPIAPPERRATGAAVKAYREFVIGAIPRGAITLVAADREPELLSLAGLEARKFPDEIATDVPGGIGSTGAIAQLEWQRTEGAEYLVLPEITRDSWAQLPEFYRYLSRHYPRTATGQHGVITHLDPSPNGSRPWQGRVETPLEAYRSRFRDPPSILDLTSGGLDVASSFPELSVATPVSGDASLHYLDDSVDLVIVGGRGDGARLGEARRIAGKAVIDLDQRTEDGRAAIHWLGEAERTLPAVSILVPSYDGAPLLNTCLRALAATVPRHLQVEVLVVDDGSSDETPELVGEWSRRDDRVRYLRNEETLGFVDACNRGAAEAEGETLVFLNNDTVPVNGWLQPLVETLVDREDAGAVGGMLLYPSGAVQEAGGVIFSDGSAANVGNGESPDDPIYRFVRAVDYCSGALLATERRTFDEIGGFDDAYRPCYYEDVDYAFRLRHAGLNTYYQPRSVVVHAEGGTAGTDTSQGAKRFQVTSRETFSRRWTKDLAERAVPPAEFDRSTWVRLARRPPVNSIP